MLGLDVLGLDRALVALVGDAEVFAAATLGAAVFAAGFLPAPVFPAPVLPVGLFALAEPRDRPAVPLLEAEGLPAAEVFLAPWARSEVLAAFLGAAFLPRLDPARVGVEAVER